MKNLFFIFRNKGHIYWDTKSAIRERNFFQINYSWICNNDNITRIYYNI